MNLSKVKTILQSDIVKHLFLLTISAVMFALSFPGFLFVNGISFFGLIALAPLFYVILNTKKSNIPIYSLYFSLNYSFLLFYWLINFNKYSIHIVVVFLWIYFWLVFYIMHYLNAKFRGLWPLVFPLIWVCFEYCRTIGFLGYPYGLLGYTQYSNLFILQSASVYGVFGISFFLASFSALCVLLYQWLARKFPYDTVLNKKFQFAYDPRIDLVKILYLSSVILIFGFVVPISSKYYYSDKNLSNNVANLNEGNKHTRNKTLKVALIQHDRDSWTGQLDTYKKNFDLLKSLSLSALEGEPDLLVWSENAFVPGYNWYTNYFTHWDTVLLVKEFQEFADALPCAFVTGNSNGVLADSSLPPILENKKLNRTDYNSALLFKSGKLLDIHNKQRLVPFSEALPSYFPEKLINKISEKFDLQYWEKGGDYKVFNLDGICFGPQICYEDCFDNLSRLAVGQGALFFLNLTNDRWAGAESAYVFHQAFSIFRAVENRRPFLRATNSGITCLILPDGQVNQKLQSNCSSYLLVDLPLANNKITIYSKYGNYFVVICFVILLFVFACSLKDKTKEILIKKKTL